ncbi:MAG: glycosyltransferase family 2 protein [Gimesia sp.]
MDSFLVSVIIVNFNSKDKLGLCVRSLINAELNLEIIVVDNASSDTSISELSKEFSSHSNILLLQNQENMGFAKACNRGAELATGDYLLFLNPDSAIHKQGIPELVDCLASGQRRGMAGGCILNSDGSEQVGARRLVPTPWRSLVRVCHLSFLSRISPRLFTDFNLHHQPLPKQPIEVEAISGACMMVSREAYEDVGGLDEGYFLHCEDLDWCMNFRQKNWKVMFVPDAKIPHFQGACSRSRRIFVEWHKHKGMMRFYRKYFRHQYPGILMWIVTCAVWFRFGLLFCYFSVRRFLNYLKNFFRQTEINTQDLKSTNVETQENISKQS